MTQRTGRAVVFGATSYLGGFVLDALLARGLKVVAVTRNPGTASILLHGWADRIEVSRTGQVGDQRADAVVNLAYVKQAVPVGLVRQNRALASAVASAARAAGAPVVVQVSSAAVFGYRPDRDPVPGPAPHLPGDAYIEQNLLGVWVQEFASAPWSPVTATQYLPGKMFSASLGHFSDYAVSW